MMQSLKSRFLFEKIQNRSHGWVDCLMDDFHGLTTNLGCPVQVGHLALCAEALQETASELVGWHSGASWIGFVGSSRKQRGNRGIKKCVMILTNLIIYRCCWG